MGYCSLLERPLLRMTAVKRTAGAAPQVESGAIVAAGAVVSPGKTVPSGEVWAGAPAKRLRALEPEEAGFLAQAASDYAALAAVHAAENAKGLEEILARGPL